MGQAKQRRAALRDYMLKEGEKWNFPQSPWEVSVCKELRAEDIVVVPRVPADQLSEMRMLRNECHANTRWYAENDPSGKTKAITGWWVQWPNFVVHSVIEQDGRLFCITPSATNESEIEFIPDPKIVWVLEGDGFSAYRGGYRVGPGVRKYPALTFAQCEIIRRRLLTGVDPHTACNFSDEEMAELIRHYVNAEDQTYVYIGRR
jgi:hypothetical protein